MNELITNQKCMTSLEIAEVTGKQHAHVMRDIRNLLSQGHTQTLTAKKDRYLILLQKVALFLLRAMTLFFVKG